MEPVGSLLVDAEGEVRWLGFRERGRSGVHSLEAAVGLLLAEELL